MRLAVRWCLTSRHTNPLSLVTAQVREETKRERERESERRAADAAAAAAVERVRAEVRMWACLDEPLFLHPGASTTS